MFMAAFLKLAIQREISTPFMFPPRGADARCVAENGVDAIVSLCADYHSNYGEHQARLRGAGKNKFKSTIRVA